MKSHRVPGPAREILAYFLRNPAASDSLEGIARWRLLEQAIHRTVTETEGALSWLVQEGYLIEMPRQSRRIYCLNPQKQQDAQELLVARRRT